jgi:hypothetical protein
MTTFQENAILSFSVTYDTNIFLLVFFSFWLSHLYYVLLFFSPLPCPSLPILQDLIMVIVPVEEYKL